MVKDLKVFGGGWHGEERRIVATTSNSKALELTGCSRGFMCESRNPLELEVAFANPGVVYGFNTRETRFPKVVEDFKKITAKKVKIAQQTRLGACDSGCGCPATSFFLETSVATCGSLACVELQKTRWEQHCKE